MAGVPHTAPRHGAGASRRNTPTPAHDKREGTVTSTPITLRHRSAPSLTPAFAAQIAEYVPESMLVLAGETWTITWANRAARLRYAGVAGDAEATLIGQALPRIVPRLEERGVLAQLRHALRSGESFSGQMLECVPPDGNESIWWEYAIVPLAEADQPATHVLIVASDRTAEYRQRLRAEDAAFSAQRYAEWVEGIIEQISEGVIITDAEGAIVTYNRAALALARNRRKVEHARARGKRIAPRWDLLHPDGSEVAPIQYPDKVVLLTGRRVTGSQMIAIRSGKRLVPLLADAAPLRDESGGFAGAVVVLQDITAMKEQERLKDEFISHASHELRQPLTVISGQAQMLERQVRRMETDPSSSLRLESLHQHIEIVQNEALRLNRLVNDLLDLSRIQAGKLRLECAPTPLLATLRQMIQRHDHDEAHSFTLDVRLPEGMSEVTGFWDRNRIEQIVMNLLSNALKYSPYGGEIRVTVSLLPRGAAGEEGGSARARTSGPAAHIAISDQGIGIPPDALRHLFEQFFRARNTGGIQGTGLGLYICRQLAREHNGELWAESGGPQAGSTFHLMLPISATT